MFVTNSCNKKGRIPAVPIKSNMLVCKSSDIWGAGKKAQQTLRALRQIHIANWWVPCSQETVLKKNPVESDGGRHPELTSCPQAHAPVVEHWVCTSLCSIPSIGKEKKESKTLAHKTESSCLCCARSPSFTLWWTLCRHSSACVVTCVPPSLVCLCGHVCFPLPCPANPPVLMLLHAAWLGFLQQLWLAVSLDYFGGTTLTPAGQHLYTLKPQ